jgi:aryl-alcohol dehydrogenase-like predicted oxidoreductase
MTISQVALSWVINREYITSAIIGVASVSELEENMKVLSPEYRLTSAEVNKKLL